MSSQVELVIHTTTHLASCRKELRPFQREGSYGWRSSYVGRVDRTVNVVVTKHQLYESLTWISPSPSFLTCRIISLPRIRSHRDRYDCLYGTFAREGWNFGFCRAAFTGYSGEVAQARWHVWWPRRAGGVSDLRPIKRAEIYQQ